MEDNIMIYDFDMVFMAYKGIYLYAYSDKITREIKYRLEDENTINSRSFNFSKNIIDDITIEDYIKYVKKWGDR